MGYVYFILPDTIVMKITILFAFENCSWKFNKPLSLLSVFSTLVCKPTADA